MRANELNLGLAASGKGPLYLQVAQSVRLAIEDRRIRPGVALPGVRDLAERLGVTVNTILTALRELQAQGWVESRERVGFFVADPLPSGLPPASANKGMTGAAGFEIPAHLSPISSTANVMMDFSEAMADARLAPAQALGRAYQRALKLKGPELLGTADVKGHARLREGLCAHLRVQRAIEAGPDQVLVLSSMAMAITVVSQAFLGAQGGLVAVENPGNPHLWESIRQAGRVDLRPLAVDAEGASPADLEALIATSDQPVRLLVLSPQCHFPTGVALSEARRRQFLDLARQHRFPILELDAEYDYLMANGAQPRPLVAEDPGQVIYVGDLSRILAPGTRAAYLIAPQALSDLLAKARRHLDWQGDPVQEWALSELLIDGEIQRQLFRVRKAAAERKEALEDALQHALAGRLETQSGAMGLWLKGLGPLQDPAAFTVWVRGCQSRGLKLRLGKHYDLLQKDHAATRMEFTAFTPEELQVAVALMT